MNLGPREHRSASLRLAVAEGLPEELRPLVLEIVDLQAKIPGRGDANGLMAEVCHEADQWWFTLLIQVRAFGDVGPDEVELERFYRKFGFRRIQDSPVLMARSPRVPMIQAVH